MNLFEYAHSEEEKAAAAQLRARHDAGLQRLRHEVSEAGHRRTYQAMLDSVKDWQVPELPQLDAYDEVIIDLETTGLRWWDGDKMIGAGLWTPDGVARYLPIRHKLGANIPEAQFFEWCRRELRGKRIVNIRTKFDLHMFRADGIDLERQGCTFGDVAHYAGLLDDHRKRFNQEDLARHFLEDKTLPPGTAGKVHQVLGYELDPTRFAEYPAGLVAPRAEGDVRTVALLQKVMWPMLTEQDLHEVRQIEDAIIPVVVEMEHNGALLDVELLNKWVKDSARDLDTLRLAIRRGTGVAFEKFTNRQNAMRLFQTQGVPVPLDPETPYDLKTGEPNYSFADALLRGIPNRWIRAYRSGLQLESLRSKFLLKYQASTARDGILRYELHQMPYQKESSEGGGGAVSGRFSSAAPNHQEGGNIQQVFGVDSQKKNRTFTRKYIVKKLFVPADRRAQYVNADASQLQFRIFGHYANDEKIIQSYQRDYSWEEIDRRAAEKRARGEKLTKADKLVDFHEAVGDLVLQFAGLELTRTHTKNVNFAQVFGAGIRKMAAQLGVPANQIPAMHEPVESGGPEFQKVVSLSETYHGMFPSVKPLLALTSHLAMPDHKTGRDGQRKCGEQCRKFCRQGYEHRGWVRTFAGRRARFGPHDRHYSALNRIIQGTEADLIKKIMIEVHAERERLGFLERFTVHDALAGDLHGDPRELKRTLNHQYYDFKVPILWEVGVGKNWAEAK